MDAESLGITQGWQWILAVLGLLLGGVVLWYTGGDTVAAFIRDLRTRMRRREG